MRALLIQHVLYVSNNWIYTVPKSIKAQWNENSLIQDLTSGNQVYTTSTSTYLSKKKKKVKLATTVKGKTEGSLYNSYYTEV